MREFMDLSKFREDFPIFEKKINGRDFIYFDNACVTFKPRQVIEKMNEYYFDYTGCGGRSHHSFADKVSDEISKSRESMRKFIGAKKKEEMIFTRNTTEGINLVSNSIGLKSGDKVLLSDKEHNSNLVPWLKLKKKGIIVEQFKFGNIKDFEQRVKGAKIASFVHTSNLDGNTQDVHKLTKIAHKNKALVHIDAAQSVPHKEINVRSINADLMTFSGHKMLGPSGTGVLYGKKEVLEKMEQFMVGGQTVIETWYDKYEEEILPNKFEAGLQNYSGNIGLGVAAEYIKKIGFRKMEKHEIMLNKHVSESLGNEVEIFGGNYKERAGIFSFVKSGCDVHEIALLLNNSSNIMIRSGAHCVHSWFNAHNLKGSARASFYFYNTLEECDSFIDKLRNVLKIIKK